MFNALYEFTLGNDHLFTDESVYMTVGLVTLLVSLGLCAIYYLVLNRVTDKYDQLTHWGGVLIITLLFAGIFGYMEEHRTLVEQTEGNGTVTPILFWVMNMIYALIYFLLGSLLFKNLSKYATKIPF